MHAFELRYEHDILFDGIPLAWTTRFEFFTPDLEQFPLMYVHKKINVETRVFGFPMNCSVVEQYESGLCKIKLKFLCNLKQGNEHIDKVIFEELSHRIGFFDKVEFSDLETICGNSKHNLPLLTSIWTDKISKVYGSSIPHGKLFDEVYGIVRWSASGNAPRLGKTSELRMLYWYMKEVGERISFVGETEKYNFCEFYIIPDESEIRSSDFTKFPNFRKYLKAVEALWNLEYTGKFEIGEYQFRYAEEKGTLPSKATDFENRYAKLLPEYYDEISWLRQIFNRMPGRLYGYVWNMMTFIETGFKEPFRDRENFRDFVKFHHRKKDCSSKILACILQQSFGLEALPIDTWVKTFIYYPLAINPLNNGKSNNPSKEDVDKLYESFAELDKLEKIIWVSSMGNKTNKTEFEDILWCQRYGTDMGDKGPCRGVNPLSCSQCCIRENCLGFARIKSESVVVSQTLDAASELMLQNNSLFGIVTHHNTPRVVLISERDKIVLRDTHTGLSISTEIQIKDSISTVEEIINIINE